MVRCTQGSWSVKPLPTGHVPDWTVPSSSLHDCLGRVRRVKAKPLRGRFASLDTTATAREGSYEEDGGDAGHAEQP